MDIAKDTHFTKFWEQYRLYVYTYCDAIIVMPKDIQNTNHIKTVHLIEYFRKTKQFYNKFLNNLTFIAESKELLE